jgi:hypothetical protein
MENDLIQELDQVEAQVCAFLDGLDSRLSKSDVRRQYAELRARLDRLQESLRSSHLHCLPAHNGDSSAAIDDDNIQSLSTEVNSLDALASSAQASLLQLTAIQVSLQRACESLARI